MHCNHRKAAAPEPARSLSPLPPRANGLEPMPPAIRRVAATCSSVPTRLIRRVQHKVRATSPSITRWMRRMRWVTSHATKCTGQSTRRLTVLTDSLRSALVRVANGKFFSIPARFWTLGFSYNYMLRNSFLDIRKLFWAGPYSCGFAVLFVRLSANSVRGGCSIGHVSAGVNVRSESRSCRSCQVP